MKPYDVFYSGRDRAEYLVKLHALLCNIRKRGMRGDWAKDFKAFMHWPQKKAIHRIDGEHCMLILREASDLTPKHFNEETLNELLRAALAGIVSALDRYCHDLIVSNVVRELSRSERKMNRELKQLYIPVVIARKAVKHAGVRKGKGGKIRTRPMNIIRDAVQEVLHREETFQRPDDVMRALRMIGIEKLWDRCAERMTVKSKTIPQRLNRIVDRRNRIVHEGDVVRLRRGRKLTLHPVNRKQTIEDIKWVSELVSSIDAVTSN